MDKKKIEEGLKEIKEATEKIEEAQKFNLFSKRGGEKALWVVLEELGNATKKAREGLKENPKTKVGEEEKEENENEPRR